MASDPPRARPDAARLSLAPVRTAGAFVVQAVSAFFFVSDILFSLLGISIPPIDWRLHELMEIAAAVGLVAGLVLGAQALLSARREAAEARERLRRAALAFHDLLEERFAEWRLTAAERDVALFALKGMSTAEIAQLRATSEGTVKAQTAAIYRKAGVSGRGQLLSLFIEDLMEDAPVPVPAEPPRAEARGLRRVG